MRDLKADLEIRKDYEKNVQIGYYRITFDIAFAKKAREGWPEAIERAINAEAELTKTKRALELACDVIAEQIIFVTPEEMMKAADRRQAEQAEKELSND